VVAWVNVNFKAGHEASIPDTTIFGADDLFAGITFSVAKGARLAIV
jgi:hypothetical protein